MTDGEIERVPLFKLVRAVKERQKYAFLIGAGSSKPAGIPTGKELTNTWRKECFEDKNPGEDFEAWVNSKEEKQSNGDTHEDSINEGWEYGFWFEERHPTRGERRERIEKLVGDATPTLGHIILAIMMDERYVPHVLTPNFDDLLYDAFYRFLGERPQLVNHRAVAPEFKLTRQRPAIVKLHGDYLYDNLQNTDTETASLRGEMEEALIRTASEYGLVVVGYGGTDDSIMDPLIEMDRSEFGIYWCTRSPDKLSEKATQLLQQENTYLVEIDGFVKLMTQLHQGIDDIDLPKRGELVERAEERADQIHDALEKYGEEADDEEEEKYVDKQQKFAAANKAHANGNYEWAIELWNEVIDLDPENAAAYYNRGNAKRHLDEYEAAIEDFDRAIDLDPEHAAMYNHRGLAKQHLGEDGAAIEDYDKAIGLFPEYVAAYNNRGLAKQHLGENEAAIKDYDKAINLDPEYAPAFLNRAEARIEIGGYERAGQDAQEAHSVGETQDEAAKSLLLQLIPMVVLGEETTVLEEEYRNLCDEEFTTSWDFDRLDSWLESTDLDPDKRDKIEELIDLLREHKE